MYRCTGRAVPVGILVLWSMPRKRTKKRKLVLIDEAPADAIAPATPITPPHTSVTGAAALFETWQEQDADSKRAGHAVLEWLLHPMSPQTFFDKYWEQKPLVIRRPEAPDYYAGFFCRGDIDQLLANGKLTFEQDLDITKYVDGKRHLYNGTGLVSGDEAWAKFRDGCSLRMLCPQSHCPKVWRLLSLLEHCFGSFVGANSYLTPAATQGFAPHYDDIEAFILQVEGAKEWRVYAPVSPGETLPRSSSADLTHADIGEPVLTATLRAGELLYFPRGWVHEARSVTDADSLHLTVSTALRHTWRDLLEILLPATLDLAASEDIDFRQTLPPDMREYMGVMHSGGDLPEGYGADEDGDGSDPRRRVFNAKLGELLLRCTAPTVLPTDGSVDQVGEPSALNTAA